MISIVRFINTAHQRAKSGTSGYDNPTEAISKANDVQTEAIEYLAPFAESNQQVKDALAVFTKTKTGTSNVDGSLTKGDVVNNVSDYVHLLSIEVYGKPSYPKNNNEMAIIKRSPIRQPTRNGPFYHVQRDDKFLLYPNEDLPYEMVYIRRPALAALPMVPASSNDDDYLVPASVGIVDLEWPESTFNLLLYMFMEKMGIEMKEQILVEYANLGIQRDQTKPQAQ